MQNIKIRNTLQMTSLLFGMTILFCYIAWSLGYEGFIIVGDIDIPDWLNILLCSLLLCIDVSLRTGFTLNMFTWKLLYFSIPITIISNLIWPYFLPQELFTGPIITIILAVFILVKKQGKSGFIRLGIYTAVIILYQVMVSEFSMLDLTVHISVYQGLRLSINNILINLLFFSIGGAHNVSGLEFMVFPRRTRDERNSSENFKTSTPSTDDIPVDKFERWVMRSVIGVVQILQWMFILWVCNFDNLFLDALVMTTSFICHGMIISKRQHLKPIILCTLAATAMFYFAARFTISFQYSQFFPIVIGLILTYTIYRISYQFETAAKIKAMEDLERIKALEAKVNEAWDRFDELS